MRADCVAAITYHRCVPRNLAIRPNALRLALVVALVSSCGAESKPVTPGSCVTRADCAADAMCTLEDVGCIIRCNLHYLAEPTCDNVAEC